MRRRTRKMGSKAGARRAATLIGVTMLAEYGVNLALVPLIVRMSHISSASFAGQCCNALLYLVVFFVPFFVFSRVCGWSFRELNGNGRPDASVFFMAICLAAGWNLIATYLGMGIEQILHCFGVSESTSSYVVPEGPAALMMQIVQLAVLPPLVEELCYRGFFLKAARQSMGIWPSIVLTSLAFWLAHDSITILPLAFGFGILGGVFRVRYQSLFPSMCAHFVVNSSYILINYVQAMCSMSVQMEVYGVFAIVEVLALFLGIGTAARCGLFQTVREYIRQAQDGQGGQRWYGVFTSVPFWIMLGSVVYFTGRNLEVLI